MAHWPIAQELYSYTCILGFTYILISTLTIGGAFWIVQPRDFPSTEWCPEGKARGTSQGPREILRKRMTIFSSLIHPWGVPGTTSLKGNQYWQYFPANDERMNLFDMGLTRTLNGNFFGGKFITSGVHHHSVYHILCILYIKSTSKNSWATHAFPFPCTLLVLNPFLTRSVQLMTARVHTGNASPWNLLCSVFLPRQMGKCTANLSGLLIAMPDNSRKWADRKKSKA